MANQELDELLRRITNVRDYAHDRARTYFAEMDDPETSRERVNLAAHRGQTFRCIAQTLNAVLGVDEHAGDDYTELYPPSGE